MPSDAPAVVRAIEIGAGRPELTRECWRIRDFISRAHHLYERRLELDEELTRFQLYRDWDRGMALTVCFIVACQGRELIEGLRADYSPEGIYYDLAPTQYMPDGLPGFWDRLRLHYREGDRILNHWSPGYRMICLFRGDRIVDEFPVQHESYAPGYRDVHYARCAARYEEQGGVRAYLQGQFVWNCELMESLRLPTDAAESRSYIRPELLEVALPGDLD